MTEKQQQYISKFWLPHVFQFDLLCTLNSSHGSCLCTFLFWQYFRQWLPLF